MSLHERRFEIDERPRTPWLSVILGYGPMFPMVVGAVLFWATHGDLRKVILRLLALYAASILIFLAGVRRGLSFRTSGGPTATQIVTMFGLYMLGALALLAQMLDASMVALALLLAGFVGVLVLDPLAARNGEAPLFFARLRPPQMAIACASLVFALARGFVR